MNRQTRKLVAREVATNTVKHLNDGFIPVMQIYAKLEKDGTVNISTATHLVEPQLKPLALIALQQAYHAHQAEIAALSRSDEAEKTEGDTNADNHQR